MPMIGSGLIRHRTWWLAGGPTCVGAFQAKGAATKAISYINLVNPVTSLTEGPSAPAWSASTGWTFTSALQNLKTIIVPASNWTMVARISSATVELANHIVMGSRNAAPDNGMFIWTSRSVSLNGSFSYGNRIIFAPFTDGVLGIAGPKGYINKTLVTSSLANSISGAQPIYIGCLNDVGVASVPFVGSIQAVWIGNTVISQEQYFSLVDAMAAL